MFTGLVECLGEILHLKDLGDQARLELKAEFSGELKLGDSVAINGCCLTVAQLEDEIVSFDILHQTLRLTSLRSLKAGSKVNLERALRLGDRLGGHFVQGHVDGVGEIKELRRQGQDHIIRVVLPAEIRRFCVDRGSIAIDGISLTIAELGEEWAEFWITPHTFRETNLAVTNEGAIVNLEADMLAKHVAGLIGR